MQLNCNLNASVNSKCQPPPPPPPQANPVELFEAVKKPSPRQNFSAKARPQGQKTPTPGKYFRRSSQPFLLIGVEILEFCRNPTLKRIRRLSNSSLVIPLVSVQVPYLKVLKFSHSFETDFVTREQLQMVDHRSV